MASGILGQINLTTASTWTSVYTVPAGKVATLNLNSDYNCIIETMNPG